MSESSYISVIVLVVRLFDDESQGFCLWEIHSIGRMRHINKLHWNKIKICSIHKEHLRTYMDLNLEWSWPPRGLNSMFSYASAFLHARNMLANEIQIYYHILITFNAYEIGNLKESINTKNLYLAATVTSFPKHWPFG